MTEFTDSEADTIMEFINDEIGELRDGSEFNTVFYYLINNTLSVQSQNI